jgi:death-on-curing protein
VPNDAGLQIEYLTLADVEVIHRDLMAGSGAHSILLRRGALEGAVHRPRNVAYYENADLFMQTATLMGGIALAHAFEDGNKRLAYACGLTFLRQNGIRIIGSAEAIADQVIAIVNRGAQTLDEASASCAAWLAAHAEAV